MAHAIEPVRPRGDEVRRLRESIVINGHVCTREEFGAPLLTHWERVKDYELEARGARAPALWWLLARITWDALARAQWIKSLPKKEP